MRLGGLSKPGTKKGTITASVDNWRGDPLVLDHLLEYDTNLVECAVVLLLD
jgi:hypothetical protein